MMSEVEQIEQLIRGTQLKENRFQSTREVPENQQQSTEFYLLSDNQPYIEASSAANLIAQVKTNRSTIEMDDSCK